MIRSEESKKNYVQKNKSDEDPSKKKDKKDKSVPKIIQK